MIERPFVWLLRLLIGLYKKLISPILPPACRYYPTCSSYADEALERHGLFRGLAYAIWRILRCNPFSDGGIDPVPGSEGGSS